MRPIGDLEVTMAEHVVVRMRGELLRPLKNLVENAKNDFGGKKYDSIEAAVTQAVTEFLRHEETKELPPKEVTQ